jgi:hypothetical protein
VIISKQKSLKAKKSVLPVNKRDKALISKFRNERNSGKPHASHRSARTEMPFFIRLILVLMCFATTMKIAMNIVGTMSNSLETTIPVAQVTPQAQPVVENTVITKSYEILVVPRTQPTSKTTSVAHLTTAKPRSL